jgi:hypothetical protein
MPERPSPVPTTSSNINRQSDTDAVSSEESLGQSPAPPINEYKPTRYSPPLFLSSDDHAVPRMDDFGDAYANLSDLSGKDHDSIDNSDFEDLDNHAHTGKSPALSNNSKDSDNDDGYNMQAANLPDALEFDDNEFEHIKPTHRAEESNSEDALDDLMEGYMISRREFRRLREAYDRLHLADVLEPFDFEHAAGQNIPPALLNHMRLLKVQRRCNVTLEAHNQYVNAFRRMHSESIGNVEEEPFLSSLYEADNELADITGIRHVRYDVC